MKNIEKLGWCNDCKEWIPLKEHWLPEHNNQKGEQCKGSRYSYWGFEISD
ncbi:MAG TPA: hypothetical protein VMC85_13070 [Desulfomonilaceae bacterium]|nr:hypothetical protein [Desulfomonilaceae bacterium]HVN77805.1 hypothetical protein [Terriglobia bacterium]